MNRQAIPSSSLRSVGYDPAERKLEIEFHGRDENGDHCPGRIAEYENVSPAQHAALLKGGGKHFHAEIRGNAAHPWRYVK